ncbi:hypothetical protein DRO61_03865 [Candidatus Bathyarchaeota archaeon]|nr:MAG: hypothetical protein DRO61_03865 [Candidatus Bathyarchaeota archaeon]
MKDNHIPRIIRLHNRLRKLTLKQSNGWTCKKFYPECVHCGITNVQMSINGDHHVGCLKRGMDKQVKYWKGLIAEEERSEKARRFNALAIFDTVPVY